MTTAMWLSAPPSLSSTNLRFHARTTTNNSSLKAASIKPSLGFQPMHNFPCNPLVVVGSPRGLIQPIVARRICPFLGKKANKANRVSHSNHKTIVRQHVNLQYKRIWWEEGKRYVKLRLSTKALRTIERDGLDAKPHVTGLDSCNPCGTQPTHIFARAFERKTRCIGLGTKSDLLLSPTSSVFFFPKIHPTARNFPPPSVGGDSTHHHPASDYVSTPPPPSVAFIPTTTHRRADPPFPTWIRSPARAIPAAGYVPSLEKDAPEVSDTNKALNEH
ncbi:Large ribosomal subunit protein bL28c-like protein [Drosera capensis]